MSKSIKIGQLLVEQGVLTDQQVFEICQAQKKTGTPFGVLAERMFDVTIDSIEQAWSEQYHRHTGTVDISQLTFDPQALSLIHRRQAWQFLMLPIRFESTGELLLAAAPDRMARAVTFVARQLEPVVYLRVAETQQIREYLQIHYPMPQVPEELIQQARELVYDRR